MKPTFTPIIKTRLQKAKENRFEFRTRKPNGITNSFVYEESSTEELNNTNSSKLTDPVDISPSLNNEQKNITMNESDNTFITQATTVLQDLDQSDLLNSNSQHGGQKSDDRTLKLNSVCNLLGPEWLDDNIIRRYYDIVNGTLLSSHEALCLNPTISQAIKLLEDYTYLLEPLHLQKADYLFIPINDCNDSSGGGSHWSLLVYERKYNTFYYYDSIKSHNLKHAELTAKKLYERLLTSQENNMTFIECTTPQQNNSYDCGIYLIILTEYIVGYLNYKNNEDCYLRDLEPLKLCDTQVITKRSQIAYILLNTTLSRNIIRGMFFGCTYGNQNIPLNNSVEKNLAQDKNTSERDEKWTQVVYKKKNYPPQQHVNECIDLTNKYDILSDKKEEFDILASKKSVKSSYNRLFSRNMTKTKTKNKKRGDYGFKKSHKSSEQIGVVDGFQSDNFNDDNFYLPKSINIYSDSMGSQLSHILETSTIDKGANVKVFGLCKPGAPLSEVVSGIQPPNDGETLCNVIIAGANDAAQGKIGPIFTALDSFLRIQSNTINLVATIPFRHDIPIYDYFNSKVEEANLYIKEVVSRYDTSHIIDLGKLKRFHYTRHGFHLNQRGKHVLARMISSKLKKMPSSMRTNGVQHQPKELLESPEMQTNTLQSANTHTPAASPIVTPGLALFSEKVRGVSSANSVKVNESSCYTPGSLHPLTSSPFLA